MSLNPSFIEIPGRFTYFNIGCYLGPGGDQISRTEQNKRALEFFQYYKLVPTVNTPAYCTISTCKTLLSVEKDKSKNCLGFRWKCMNTKCEQYKKKLSPLTNTLFSKSNMPLKPTGADTFGLSSCLKLLTSWYFRMGVTEARLHGDISSPVTSSQWYRRFRKVAQVSEDHESEKIGGDDDIVEVDESHLFTRKYNVGRVLYSQKNLWIFGGVSRLTGKKFAVRVDARNKETLHCEMLDHIEGGSYIISDGWTAYQSSPEACGFKGHSWVNHSKGQFVDPEGAIVENLHKSLGTRILIEPPSTSTDDPSFRQISVHTNTVERMWRDMKSHCKSMRGNDELVDEMLGEWLYRKNVLEFMGSDHGLRFQRFLSDIARVFPGLGVEGINLRNECLCSSCEHPMEEELAMQ